MNWDGTEVLKQESNYCKRRIIETIWIHRSKHNSNLDCGLTLNQMWLAHLESTYNSLQSVIIYYLFLFVLFYLFACCLFYLFVILFYFIYFIIFSYFILFIHLFILILLIYIFLLHTHHNRYY